MGLQGTPFPFEGPVAAELMIDRHDELDELARRAADRVNVRLVAPRRYGKTSLAGAHSARMRESGWRTVYVDLSRVADLTDVARRIATAYGALDGSWLRAHLAGPLARLGLSISAAGPVVSLGPRPVLTDAGAAADAVLPALLDLPAELWRRDGTPTLVVLDEFQDLLVARDDLDGLLRSRMQHHGDAAAYVFAGSEPTMMRELFDKRERPLFGQAMPLTLGPLAADQVVADLSERFASEDLAPGAALGLLVAFAGGHPQRTMLLAYLLADAMAGDAAPTAELADDVVTRALALTDAAHQALWQDRTPVERALLAAVADGVPPSSRRLAESHRLARTTLARAADRLAQQGLLVRDEGVTHLVDPLLGEWLRRR